MVSASSVQDKRLQRRIRFFKRVGIFHTDSEGFEVTRALDVSDLTEAYALVHDSYAARGYMKPRAEGIRIRAYEAMPEMATFVARAEGRVVAVTSVLMDSAEMGLPSDHVFGHELVGLRSQGRRVCEITNLAVHPDYRNTPVFGELTRCCLAHAMAIGYDDLFIAISPEHGKFFSDVLLFDPWGGKRDYGDDVEDIVVGMRLNLTGLDDRAARRDMVLGDQAFLESFYFSSNPFHDQVRRWAIRAAMVLRRADDLHELLIERGRLTHWCSRKELDALRQRLGDGFFERILDPEAQWGAASAEEAGTYLPARETVA